MRMPYGGIYSGVFMRHAKQLTVTALRFELTTFRSLAQKLNPENVWEQDGEKHRSFTTYCKLARVNGDQLESFTHFIMRITQHAYLLYLDMVWV